MHGLVFGENGVIVMKAHGMGNRYRQVPALGQQIADRRMIGAVRSLLDFGELTIR
mgnify:CR=1 FL=1